MFCPAIGTVSEAGAVIAGRVAPLVLIEEHLTDEFSENEYRPALQGGRLIKNWSIKDSFKPPASGEKTPVLKIQRFEQGGYEATVRMLDLEKIGDAIDRGGKRGKREAPAEISPETLEKCAQRAKRRVRYLVKNMGATNLVTLNKREGPNTKGWNGDQWEAWEQGGQELWEAENGAFWGVGEWAAAWDKQRRNLERVMGAFPYVAVLERHRKGNFHLHLAWCGKVNLNVMRPLWYLACGGNGQGNVDSKYIKVARGCERSAVISRYISKYVCKHFEMHSEFNKKRYWASRQALPEVQRFILNCGDVSGALGELMSWMQFRFEDRHNFFIFPGGEGFWWNFIPELHDTSPPPF